MKAGFQKLLDDIHNLYYHGSDMVTTSVIFSSACRSTSQEVRTAKADFKIGCYENRKEVLISLQVTTEKNRESQHWSCRFYLFYSPCDISSTIPPLQSDQLCLSLNQLRIHSTTIQLVCHWTSFEFIGQPYTQCYKSRWKVLCSAILCDYVYINSNALLVV